MFAFVFINICLCSCDASVSTKIKSTKSGRKPFNNLWSIALFASALFTHRTRSKASLTVCDSTIQYINKELIK